MIDSISDRLALANPVPATAIGGLRADVARALVDDITGRMEGTRRSRRKRLVIALLLALAIAAPVAFAATQTHLLDFALGSPAPKTVRAQFNDMLPPAYGPKEGPPQGLTRKDFILGSERLVAQTTTSLGGVARMYAVNLRGGGACWFTTGRPFGGGSCGPRAFKRIAITGGYGMLFAGMGKRQSGTFGQGVTYYGHVGAHAATSLRLAFKDGKSGFIPVHDGWFMYEVPLAHTFWGHQPVKVEALDAAGRVLATRNDPFGLQPPKRPKIEQARKPHTVLAREPLGWHGAYVELLTAKGNRGSECTQARNTKDLIQTERWTCDPAVGRDSAISIAETRDPNPQPVYWQWQEFTKFGEPNGYSYADGWVGPQVTTLEIRYQDSTVQRIPLERRLFIYVVPRSHWALGSRPSYLVGLNAAGHAIYRRFLYPRGHCRYPGPDPVCAHTIVHSG